MGLEKYLSESTPSRLHNNHIRLVFQLNPNTSITDEVS